MFDDLRRAERGGFSFPAEDYVNTFPARKHDHFPIPAGTVHCSGANSLVLDQVAAGVAVRMSVLYHLLGSDEGAMR